MAGHGRNGKREKGMESQRVAFARAETGPDCASTGLLFSPLGRFP